MLCPSSRPYLHQHKADRGARQKQSPKHVQANPLQNSPYCFNVRVERFHICSFPFCLGRFKKWIFSSTATLKTAEHCRLALEIEGHRCMSISQQRELLYFTINLHLLLGLSTWPGSRLCRRTLHQLFEALLFANYRHQSRVHQQYQNWTPHPSYFKGAIASVRGAKEFKH